jgi:outer membrane protein assembly factor BamB/serine/threonine protein kinase
MAEYETLGNYRLLRLLGEGGFSRVYLGEHLYLKTYAAIKVPKLRLESGDLEDFLNEARRGVGLRHPNVLRTLECGVEGGTQPYIIMDYAPGGTVRRRYPQGTTVPPTAIISYARQAGAGLQYIHDQGLIHQDIKPGNMLLGSNDELLLSDFGIAIVAHRTSTQSLMDASGTARYMAPEQFKGKPRPASDQYALAIVIYEWICGSAPFNGDIAELIYLHSQAAPPPLHTKTPNISPAVEQVILKALAKGPRDRFPRVQDFVDALEQAGRPVTAPAPVINPPTFPSILASPAYISPAINPPTPTPIPLSTKLAPEVLMPMVEEDIPTVGTRPPQEFKRPAQEVPLSGIQFAASHNEEAIPTIISQHNVPAIGKGAMPPTLPAAPAGGLPPFYEVAPPISREVAPRRGPMQPTRTAVLLVSLAVIVVAAGLSFFLISLKGGHGVTVTPTVTTHTQRHLTPTVPPPYSAMFGFNARHTHFIPGETTISTSNIARLTLAWKAQTSSGIRSSPLVSNGIVYITSSDNNLFAFNATTGAKLWQASTGTYVGPGSFIYSSPAIVNNVLYIGSNDHRVYAFNALTGGKPLWVSIPTGGPIYSSPAVVNGVLYIGSTDHNIYAYNTSNGSLLWKAATGGAIYSSPAVVNNVVYIGSDDSKLYALDASSGTTLWIGAAGGHIDSSPTVVDGMVYLGAADSHIYAFDATGCQGQSTCQPVWIVPTGNFINSSPAVASGILYIGSHDNMLYAFDTNQCLNYTPNNACPSQWTWSAPAKTAQPFESSPTVANGVAYIGSWDGKLYTYNAQTGTMLWSYPTGGQIISSPTVLNGMVYVGSNDQYLYAFHLG